MRIVVDRSFELHDHPDALVVRGEELWTAMLDTRSLRRYSGVSAVELKDVGMLPKLPSATGGAAWDGEHLLVADSENGRVVSVDPETGSSEKVFDTKELDFGKFERALVAGNSHITDVAWGRGVLWVACEAGYSSSIYQVDLDAKRVVGHFWSPGPNPTGLSLDPEEKRLWVIDGRKMQLVALDTNGEWLKISLPIPVPRVKHLVIDKHGNFWMTDSEAKTVHRLRMED